jgi:hypothetical protein
MNIDRYLGANQNAGADQKALADKTSAAEKSKFDTAVGGFKSAVSAGVGPSVNVHDIIQGVAGSGTPSISAPSASNQSSGGWSTGSGFSIGGGVNNTSAPSGSSTTAFTPDPNAVSQATDLLARKYTGPTSLSYDVGNTDEAHTLAGLGNVQTVGQTIAGAGGPLAKYNPGLSAIDAAIYGSQQNSSNMSGIQSGTTAQIADEKKQSGESSNLSANAVQGLVNNQNSLRAGLQGRATEIQAAADKKAADINQQQTLDQANGTLRDANGNRIVDVIPGTTVAPNGWVPGTTGNATGSNFLGSGDVSSLNAIGRILGDSNLSGAKSGPAYVAGHNTAVVPPPSPYPTNPLPGGKPSGGVDQSAPGPRGQRSSEIGPDGKARDRYTDSEWTTLQKSGWAPAGYSVDELRSRGYTDQQLARLGLITGAPTMNPAQAGIGHALLNYR